MRFIKMHGLGNDYVYVDALPSLLPTAHVSERARLPEPWLAQLTTSDLQEMARAVSDRHFGVGADGLIVILPGEDAPFRMRIFNADGSEGEMCGNGIRCVAKYLFDRGCGDGTTAIIETGAGLIETHVVEQANGLARTVRVNMGKAQPAAEGERYVTAVGRRWSGMPVSVGNPHFVILDQMPSLSELSEWGPSIEHHESFPDRTNVEFVRVDGADELTMRVWERGSGITLACGTGACASLVAAAAAGRTGRHAVVHLLGGDLTVEWAPDGVAWLEGPATEVFVGAYETEYEKATEV